jgi:hypothetical protein
MLERLVNLKLTMPFTMYSQTCIKRSSMGQRKSGLLIPVTPWVGLTVHTFY